MSDVPESAGQASQAQPPPPTQAPVDLPPPAAQAAAQQQSAQPFSAPPPPDGPPVIYHDKSLKNGISKCPYCGSSDIQLDTGTGLLHCNYCRREFAEASDGIDGDISLLSGLHTTMGASDIAFDAADVVTLKCTACGAEVVVDTNEAPQARCHWCRNMLSLNQQVPNGAIPDALMPFRITREQARALIEQFVGKRRFFAHPRFKSEFTTENIMGVYLPYMVIDINAHSEFRGEGEHETRRYTVGSGNSRKTKYDADSYAVARVFDLYVDDLTVEASTDKLNQATAVNSNNVINAILPYPLKETVRFNANYLRGFTSEKRSVNRSQTEDLMQAQVRDIARWKAWQLAPFYNRGIRWDIQDVTVKGELWKTVYLPVWLYSYLQNKPDGSKFLHYVAVNACTGETMGSVPIHKPKLLAISAIIEIIGIVLGVFLAVVLFLAT
ncbi:MAG: TFIIB-type zinc ribbon-containing protein [Coriobacteriales bacterium]|jgi:Zn finger protein HypA/HybF involved in hydrogenase expression|nr:TFIIB-type zinc ribbon-containing protein [Coriobacteriales bacterium]